MFKPVRVVATFILLAAIGLIFVAAFVLDNDVRSSVHYFLYMFKLILCVCHRSYV
jgi:hypothetical protein